MASLIFNKNRTGSAGKRKLKEAKLDFKQKIFHSRKAEVSNGPLTMVFVGEPQKVKGKCLQGLAAFFKITANYAK